MIEACLWTAPLESRPIDPVTLRDRTDVAIVGAGYTGLSAALTLARRGVSTTVLEAHRVGFGASSRNGGMALTGLKLSPDALVQRYGKTVACAFFDASLSALDALERLIETERIDCAYARTGHLEVACSRRHFEALVRTQRLLERVFNHPVRVISREELPGEIGAAHFTGGLLDERSGALDPYRYVLGLAGAARRAGALIAEGTAVQSIEPRGDGWRLLTKRGALNSTYVFLATGAYGGPEVAPLRRRLVPVGSYVIATERLPAEFAQRLIPKDRMVFDTKRLLHYFRLTPDARMLFGGRAAFVPANAETTRRSAQILRSDMVSAFPALRDVCVDYAWGGTLDVTFDLMPHAGELHGLYYATGYAGHGIALATMLGARTADAMIERRDVRPFDRALPRAPLRLYDGRPWFLPFVGAWQRLADLVS
ncbi:MAG TPA: FAD-binding oxidoreductase [Candidatus Cybelea sp.]|nr:FAD-binding oxidoreductase [Candidatus Cybelea sp.]